jgi:hypothetical protein
MVRQAVTSTGPPHRYQLPPVAPDIQRIWKATKPTQLGKDLARLFVSHDTTLSATLGIRTLLSASSVQAPAELPLLADTNVHGCLFGIDGMPNVHLGKCSSSILQMLYSILKPRIQV